MSSMSVTLWNGKHVPRMGIGTWVMGGTQFWNGKPTGWSGVDDEVSVAALHKAFERGIRIIDTADQYGGGHSERVIAEAIGRAAVPRDEFVIATKVGMVCDPQTGNVIGTTHDPDQIATAIDRSLDRLRVDQIDLVKFHLNHYPVSEAEGVFDAFSEAFEKGKIAGFGWSTDDPEASRAFSNRSGFVAVQFDHNLFEPAPSSVANVETSALWGFARQPLAMGLLTGKHTLAATPFGPDDIRGSGFDWLQYFDKQGRPSKDFLDRLDLVRTLLTQDGRSLAQGALGWILAKSDRVIPLPGCRTPDQSDDNFGVLETGPLSENLVSEIDGILGYRAC